MIVIGFVPRLEADFVPSAVLAVSPGDRDQDLGKIQKLLETKLIRERLEKLSFTGDEIQSRLANLSDEQLHQLALKSEDLRVGGDGGIIIAILLIAILVWVVVYLYGGHKIVVK